MSLIRIISGGLRALFRKQQAERDLDEELRAYAESAVAQKMQAGMSREEALRKARLEMGSMEAAETGCPRRWVGGGARKLRPGCPLWNADAGTTCGARGPHGGTEVRLTQ